MSKSYYSVTVEQTGAQTGADATGPERDPGGEKSCRSAPMQFVAIGPQIDWAALLQQLLPLLLKLLQKP